MQEKIDWYREVLEIEPNSRVFFSLARLLSDDHNPQEAIKTLKKGLDRHPEFLEARLLLIELLYKTGDQAECDHEIDMLEKMFSRYLGFWDAWAACVARKDADSASLIRFLAAQFVAGPLKINEVLNRGLEAILSDRQAHQRPHKSRAHEAADSSAHRHQLQETPAAPDPGERLPSTPAPVAVDAEHKPVPDLADLAEPEEIAPHPATSLRTRSMADVLAEQGDLTAAIEIYSELENSSKTTQEKGELAQRRKELQSLQAKGAEEPQPVAGASREKLIDMLEALATRVEARVPN